MTTPSAHPEEPHFVNRSGWLRAAVLGANDGIVSVASLIVGMAAADPVPHAIALAGIAGLVAGAMSMAAGEYVSVSSQSDIERADIMREKRLLDAAPEKELAELTAIYRQKGLQESTAKAVARELTEHDALGAHIRDELGLSEIHAARPLQAALASGATFSVAAAIPLIASLLAPTDLIIPVVLLVTVVCLGLLGAIGATVGGAPRVRAIARVVAWGIFAMLATAGIGHLVGVNL